MSGTTTMRRPTGGGPFRVRRVRRVAGFSVVGAVAVVLVALPGCLDSPHMIDRLTIENPTRYDISVDATDHRRRGWIVLGTVHRGTTSTFEQIVENLFPRTRVAAVVEPRPGEQPTLEELEQLSRSEVAEVLAIPQGTVATRLKRARDACLAALRRLHRDGAQAVGGQVAFSYGMDNALSRSSVDGYDASREANFRRHCGRLAEARQRIARAPQEIERLERSWRGNLYWLLLLAIGVQVGGWLLISISLPRLPAAITSVVLTLQPVGSVLLGIWILSEAPSSLQLLGVLFIIAGLLMTTLRVRRRSARRAQPEVG